MSPPGCQAERVQPDWSDTRRRRRNSCCCCDLWQVVEVGAIRRSRIKARMRALAVVKRQVTADRSLGFCNTVVGPKVGEWREALQPCALSEPDVNLSIHPAPIIQPLVPKPSGRTCLGC